MQVGQSNANDNLDTASYAFPSKHVEPLFDTKRACNKGIGKIIVTNI